MPFALASSTWALELEAAGVCGEGHLTFSKRDRDATAATFNISGGSFTGNVGPMVGGKVTATVQQSAPELMHATEALADQAQSLAAHMGLPPDRRAAIESAAAVVKEESAKPKPDKAKMKTALSTIATIAEGAAGNLVASGVMGIVPRLVAALGGL